MKGEVMLVLSRKRSQEIVIGNNIRIVVIDTQNDKARIGVEAPRDVSVHRREIYDKKKKESES